MPRRNYPIGTILFFLFSAFTLLELWILVLLTKATSLGFTILVTIVSAIVGASLAKREGIAVLQRAQAELAAGRLPAKPLADGVMILIGGALLITPGLITDFIGFTTLLPFCRRFYSKFLMNWAKRHFQARAGAGSAGQGGFRFYTFTNSTPPPPSSSTGPGPSHDTESPDEEPHLHVFDLDREKRLAEWREQVRDGDDEDDTIDAEFEDNNQR